MNLPEKFLDNMKALLKDEFQDYIDSFGDERKYGLRINTLKTTAQEVKGLTDFIVDKVPWCETGYYYDGEKRPAKHPCYYAGLYYLQEPSAMAPGDVLPVCEGDRVLDICAAPGGKSTQLAARLNGTGILVTNDISPSRAGALVKNIELFGVKNNVTLSDSPEKIAKKLPEFFDKILVDAPCSGEGMFRKEPDTIKSWDEEKIQFCVNAQRDILFSCAKMLKKGGYMLYSTCTFAPVENEKTINDFLDTHEDFEIVEIPEENGFAQGLPEMIENGRENLKGAARLWPHRINGEGHFLCLLRRKEGENYEIPVMPFVEKDKRIAVFEKFCKESLDTEFNGYFYIHKDSLFLCPEGLPDMKGIRVARSGWHLGDFKKDRFEPSFALAAALKKDEARLSYSLAADSIDVIKYLKGETIDCDLDGNGWCLVCMDEYPLGWAKLVNGRLKNKYPSYLKWE